MYVHIFRALVQVVRMKYGDYKYRDIGVGLRGMLLSLITMGDLKNGLRWLTKCLHSFMSDSKSSHTSFDPLNLIRLYF